MDTKSLRFFLAVAEHRNFTKAAEQLYSTQSTLSHNIAELEAELDTKLFHRTTRSVSLTPSGEVLYKNAKDLIARFERIETEIRKADSGTSGEIIIGHLLSPFKDFLPAMKKHFQAEYPDIKVRFVRKNLAPLTEALIRREIDVLFTMSFGIDSLPDIQWKPLFPDGMSLALYPDHPLAGAESIDYPELGKEDFVTLEEGESPIFHSMMLRVCAARGFIPNIVATPPAVDSVLMDVRAGFGIAIVPTNLGKYYKHDLEFIELEGEDTKFYEAAAWRKDNSNPTVPLFLSSIDRFLEKSV
ncbi:MAG: LysR family transcriptional regulator [Clostridiales bacterium]|nr:LysR family transcriptional regulator [Clostridiales bacterium]